MFANFRFHPGSGNALQRGGITLCWILGFSLLIGGTARSGGQVAHAADQEVFVAPLRPLLDALAGAGVSGSIELSGRCAAGPSFPNLRSVSTGGGSPLEVARELFADDPAMKVKQEGDGTVRMVEAGISAELLSVKIKHLSFERNGVPLQSAAFSPSSALVNVILQSPEVIAFVEGHDILMPGGLGGSIGNQAIPVTSPHIEGSMDNVTLLQALDRLVKTFPGVWVYENCPANDNKKSRVYFWFFSLQNPGVFPQRKN